MVNSIYGLLAAIIFYAFSVLGAFTAGLLAWAFFNLVGEEAGTTYTTGGWQDIIASSLAVILFHIVIIWLLKKDDDQ